MFPAKHSPLNMTLTVFMIQLIKLYVCILQYMPAYQGHAKTACWRPVWHVYDTDDVSFLGVFSNHSHSQSPKPSGQSRPFSISFQLYTMNINSLRPGGCGTHICVSEPEPDSKNDPITANNALRSVASTAYFCTTSFKYFQSEKCILNSSAKWRPYWLGLSRPQHER